MLLLHSSAMICNMCNLLVILTVGCLLGLVVFLCFAVVCHQISYIKIRKIKKDSRLWDREARKHQSK